MRADFDRVYSPPEPPEPSRWRPRGWQVALISFLVAAGAVFFAAPLVLDGSPEEGVLPTLTAEHRDSTTAEESPEEPLEPEGTTARPSETAAPSPSVSSPAASGGVLEELPKKVCDTVSERTFLAWVPGGKPDEYGGSRAGSCGYTGGEGEDLRYLRLETRLGETTGDMDPITITKWSFDQDYQQQKEDEITRTLLLEKVPGFGEDAFRRVFVDVGQGKMMTARIEVRVRNVIVTVSYSRTFDGKPEDEQGKVLEGAREVAEEALRTYS